MRELRRAGRGAPIFSACHAQRAKAREPDRLLDGFDLRKLPDGTTVYMLNAGGGANARRLQTARRDGVIAKQGNCDG
jgi:hypothetical protein